MARIHTILGRSCTLFAQWESSSKQLELRHGLCII
jgi:hypothetical protein